MKSMNIAASGELIPRLSTHRNVVALDSTDFTDVAAVVITTADSRSGILALLKRTGFHLPVFTCRCLCLRMNPLARLSALRR